MINDRSANLKEYVLRFGLFAVPGPRGFSTTWVAGRSNLIPRLRWVYGKHKFAPRSIAGQ